MSHCVYCIAQNDGQAITIANRLTAAGFKGSDISVLVPNRGSLRELGHVNSTKAPEGAAAGAGTGAVFGGALGWLAGVGALAIPGVGPLIAAGPILGLLSGVALGGTVGGLAGTLIGIGIPEYEAKQYEGHLQGGGILISVHAHNSGEAHRIEEIFRSEGAEDISTGSEAAVPAK
ncbi:MAG: hypothetical protein AB7O62_25860 [Pirellulales bacterium]